MISVFCEKRTDILLSLGIFMYLYEIKIQTTASVSCNELNRNTRSIYNTIKVCWDPSQDTKSLCNEIKECSSNIWIDCGRIGTFLNSMRIIRSKLIRRLNQYGDWLNTFYFNIWHNLILHKVNIEILVMQISSSFDVRAKSEDMTSY